MTQAAEAKEEFGISAIAIDTLERDFVEVMKELSAEDNLERFRLEYEKLHRALKKSHESEKRLIKKCQELNAEIMLNAAKVQSALQLSQEDEATIASLRQQIEKAWKMVDGAHEKEARAKETIHSLELEVKNLTKYIDEGAGLTRGQENNLADMIQERKELTRECESMTHQKVRQGHELKDLQERERLLGTDVTQREAELQLKTQQYNTLQKDMEVEKKKKEQATEKFDHVKDEITKFTTDAETLKTELIKINEEISMREKLLKEEHDKVHKLQLETDKMQNEVHQQNDELDLMDARSKQCEKDVEHFQKELKAKETEVQRMVEVRDRMMEAVESQDKQIDKMKRTVQDLEKDTANYEKKVNSLNEQIEKGQRAVEQAERRVKDEVRDKNLAISTSVREEGVRVKLQGDFVIEQGQSRSVEQMIGAQNKENELLKRGIVDLEIQKRKYEDQNSVASQKYLDAVEEVETGKKKVEQLKEELVDADKRLKTQQNMYKIVRAEKEVNKKNLNESQEEIQEMQRKFKLMDHQIDQLKDDLSRKENDLCKAHSDHKKLSDEYSKEQKSVDHFKAEYEAAKGRSESLAEEIKQLAQIIADCDTEKAKQQMKFNSVTNERNILATQLIRRNDELALLYEKIKLQRSTLAKGEAQYRERLCDIRIYREKVHELRTAVRVSLSRIKSVEELKRQITTLQRQLIHERTKVKALYEELQNPMNVHRWRKLDGSDPQSFENIMKVQTLQKRLIGKTEEARKKDAIIQEKEKLYVDLKNILSRQPGPEIAEQLHIYKENITKRAEQMSKMNSELDASNVQANEYKEEVDRLNSELLTMKQRFFKLKSKNQLLVREKQLESAGYQVEDGASFIIHHPAQQPRFAGGGFSLSQ